MSWAEFAAEIQKIPPMTRIAVGSACLVAAPVFFHFYPGHNFTFYWPAITGKYQVWRLYTSVFLPWVGDGAIKWLFDVVMLYRHLLPLEQKAYHRRLPDMVWQFSLSMAAIMVIAYYPLSFPLFWTPLLGFIIYLSSRIFPNENISLFGLFTFSIKWYPYVLVAFELLAGPMRGCGIVAGLIVAQVLFMLEYQPPEREGVEPRLRPRSFLRAPGWLTQLLAEPEVQRTGVINRVYGTASAPAGRGLNDEGRGANTATTTGYNWGRGNRLGE